MLPPQGHSDRHPTGFQYPWGRGPPATDPRLARFAPRPVNLNRRYREFEGMIIWVSKPSGNPHGFYALLGKIRERGGQTANDMKEPSITHYVIDIPKAFEPGHIFSDADLAHEDGGSKKWRRVIIDQAKYCDPGTGTPDTKMNQLEGLTKTVVRREWLEAVLSGELKLGQGDDLGPWGVWRESPFSAKVDSVPAEADRQPLVHVPALPVKAVTRPELPACFSIRRRKPAPVTPPRQVIAGIRAPPAVVPQRSKLPDRSVQYIPKYDPGPASGRSDRWSIYHKAAAPVAQDPRLHQRSNDERETSMTGGPPSPAETTSATGSTSSAVPAAVLAGPVAGVQRCDSLPRPDTPPLPPDDPLFQSANIPSHAAIPSALPTPSPSSDEIQRSRSSTLTPLPEDLEDKIGTPSATPVDLVKRDKRPRDGESTSTEHEHEPAKAPRSHPDRSTAVDRRVVRGRLGFAQWASASAAVPKPKPLQVKDQRAYSAPTANLAPAPRLADAPSQHKLEPFFRMGKQVFPTDMADFGLRSCSVPKVADPRLPDRTALTDPDLLYCAALPGARKALLEVVARSQEDNRDSDVQ